MAGAARGSNFNPRFGGIRPRSGEARPSGGHVWHPENDGPVATMLLERGYGTAIPKLSYQASHFHRLTPAIWKALQKAVAG